MKRQIALITLLALAAMLAAGNSIFSYEGLPIRYYGNDIYGMSMGDTGSADIFRYNSGLSNPALHNRSNRSIFATGLVFGYTRFQSQDISGKKHKFLDNSLDLPHFSLSVPIKIHRLGFQFSSYASGLVKNKISFEDADGNEITETQKMDRYIYRGDLLYSIKLDKYSLGISGNYYFGHDIHSFDQDGGFYPYNTHEELSRTYKNPSVTLGALASYEKLSMGAYYSMQTKLKGNSIRSSLHTNEPEESYEYSLPHEAGFGLSFLPMGRHKVNLDARYEAWSQLDAQYNDALKLGLGWAYEPLGQSTESYLKKLPLRAGLSWRQLPFKVEGESVDEYGISLGLSFPLKRDINRLDFGFQALQRGSLEQNKLSDTSFMMMFGFTGFDVIGKAADRKAPREIPLKEELGEW